MFLTNPRKNDVYLNMKHCSGQNFFYHFYILNVEQKLNEQLKKNIKKYANKNN